MVRILTAVMILASFAPAHADGWMDYLEIRCEPDIGYFTVRPFGTYRFGPSPEGFTRRDEGSKFRNGEWELAETPNEISVCELGHREYQQESYRLTFKVVLTEQNANSGCYGCGSGSSRYEVWLNDHRVSAGQLGRTSIRMLSYVRFDGQDELHICETPAPLYREMDDQGGYEISCKARRVFDLIEPSP